MDEKLEQAAHIYADLAGEIKEAERNVERARISLDNLRSKQINASKTLSDSVGSNIQRRAFAFAEGIVVTVDQNAGIHVYRDGEEIR